MTFSHINRLTATVLTAAVALGTAGPAAAQQIGSNGPVPVSPAQLTHYRNANVLPPFTSQHMRAFSEAPAPVQTAAAKPVATARPKSGAPGSDVVYVVIGGVVVALGGLGGTLVAASRRRTAPARARIAA
ncbi:MAG TPA: hypothetical protein VGG07_05245 [Solirubrobacteraceae bacterium]|jgi:hypothetical protein|nr:hypothetical protein [Solirubrobacteraceae bacterium]